MKPHTTITWTGRSVDLTDPHSEDICALDIAHALAHTCRYAGNTPHHYSVAQHSIIVAKLCPPEMRAYALLHDAAEAYTGDIIRPVRNLVGIAIDRIEQPLMEVIHEHFGLPPLVPPDWAAEIHTADLVAYVAEEVILRGRDRATVVEETSLPLSAAFDNPAFDQAVALLPLTMSAHFAERNFHWALTDYHLCEAASEPTSGTATAAPAQENTDG